MINNTFTNNKAFVGAAIYIAYIKFFDLNFIWKNKFINNFAEYGPNYASYPTRLSIQSGLKRKSNKYYIDAYPGVKVSEIIIKILDHFGQLVTQPASMYFFFSFLFLN